MTVGRGGTFVNVFLIFIVWDLNYFWRMGEKAGMCSNIISEFKKEKNNFFPFFFKDARGSVYAIDLQFSATSGGEGYVGSSDVAAAAHRGVLQYICSDAHKLAVWLSPDFFVNKNAYHHAVCASPAHEHLSYIKAGHKRALCSPCILPIMLTLNGEPLWCPHTVTPHDPDPPPHTHSLLSSGVLAGVGHALRVNLWNPPSAAQQHLALLCNTSPWAVRGLVIGVWPRMGNELWLACSLGRLTPTPPPSPHILRWERATHSVGCLTWRLNSALTFQEDSPWNIYEFTLDRVLW